MFKERNLVVNNKNIPNEIIMIPPIWLNPKINSSEVLPKVLLMITPKAEKTTEKPKTKNMVFKMIFDLFTESVFVPDFWLNSVMVVPEMYAKKAGIMGSIQGATNEPSPASAAMAKLISGMSKFYKFFIKALFQI